MQKIFSISLILLISLFNISCIIRHSEYGFSKSDLDNFKYIKKDITSKNNLIDLIAEPSIEAMDDNNKLTYIYYNHKLKKILFLKPIITEYNIYVVKFNENNFVSNISYLTSLDPKYKKLLNKKYKYQNNEKSLLNILDIFNNIGVISPISGNNNNF